jgi:hypothetical protein
MSAHLKIAANQETRAGLRPRFTMALLGLASASAGGCSGPSVEPEPIAEISQALNVCEETVPTNRFIDGLPAYAQCSTTTNSAIWSSNGVDTSTTSQGTGWIRTQRSGGYQCTEWAWRYMHFKWSVDYQNGNAGSWCDGNLPATLVKATTPVHGDLIVFAPGVCGSDGTTGHIAVIDTVNAAAGTVTFVEENQAGRRSAKQTCATCFLHAVANDGSTSGGSGGLGGATATGGSPAVTGGVANGGRSASGGSPIGGALAGGGPSVAGSSSMGGSPGAAGAGFGGNRANTGGIPGSGGTRSSSTGGVASGGTATLTGGSTAAGGSSGGLMATGGVSLTGGSSGVATGGTPGASGNPGTPSAGMPGNGLDPDSEAPGCGVARAPQRAAMSGWFSSVALALGGFALRRRSGRRRG